MQTTSLTDLSYTQDISMYKETVQSCSN